VAASLPHDSDVEMQVAKMFEHAGDYEHALAEYEIVLQHAPRNVAAQKGRGEAAFQLHRYGTAEKYLAAAVRLDPRDEAASRELQIARAVIGVDPFIRRISAAERDRRLKFAFERAGDRLRACGASQGTSQKSDKSKDQAISAQSDQSAEKSQQSGLASLQQEWLALKPKVSRRERMAEPDVASTLMDLVFRIERQSQQNCGEPAEPDQALLLLAQDSDGADR